MCRVRNALAICLFFGVWLGVWSAAWLAGVYFFGTETPALFGGFFGCVAGGLGAHLFLGIPHGRSRCVASLKAKNRPVSGGDRRRRLSTRRSKPCGTRSAATSTCRS